MFVKQTDGSYKVTLKDLENEKSILWLLSLVFDSKENRELINRISVDGNNNTTYLKHELSNSNDEVQKVSINKTVNRHDKDVMEIVLTGYFNPGMTCELFYNFTNDDTQIDHGLKKENPYSLHED